jgi:prepilin-type N-terminal cleavage/methylation domain-containing protein
MYIKKTGFTLIELLIVMAVVAILVAIIIPSYRGMQHEAWMAQAEKEVQTLQTAIESYYRHHGDYPADITTVIQSAKPTIVTGVLKDPWKTSGTTYGYQTGDMTGFGPYYIVYTQSINGVQDWSISGTEVRVSGDDVVLSNLPVVK